MSFGVITAFAFFGQQVLHYLDISLAALKGAGGLLLLLVALELLSSGYAREQVTAYMRSTFGMEHAEAVIASAGLVPG